MFENWILSGQNGVTWLRAVGQLNWILPLEVEFTARHSDMSLPPPWPPSIADLQIMSFLFPAHLHSVFHASLLPSILNKSYGPFPLSFSLLPFSFPFFLLPWLVDHRREMDGPDGTFSIPGNETTSSSLSGTLLNST